LTHIIFSPAYLYFLMQGRPSDEAVYFDVFIHFAQQI